MTTSSIKTLIFLDTNNLQTGTKKNIKTQLIDTMYKLRPITS